MMGADVTQLMFHNTANHIIMVMIVLRCIIVVSCLDSITLLLLLLL